jgi:hypothetical protein
MSISIGSLEFDDYSGEILIPRKRVLTYARIDKAGIGAQVLPKIGSSFDLETIRYDAPANVATFVASVDALIGTDVAIATSTFDYSIAFSTVFTVEDVSSNADRSLLSARGVRGGSTIDLSPAKLIRCRWRFRSGPS